jgi:hypothetical protein
MKNRLEKITIDDFVCTTKELLPNGEKGLPNNNPCWDMSHYSQSMISKEDWYKNVSAALHAVCNVLSFDYDRNDWRFKDYDKSFHASFYVDENNNQITEEEYGMWKRGEKRIWVCDVSVHALLTETREINNGDLPKIGYRKH